MVKPETDIKGRKYVNKEGNTCNDSHLADILDFAPPI
jgi:hypothetical protein